MSPNDAENRDKQESRSIDDIVNEFNARARAEGRYLDKDFWEIPRPGSILDVPETPESKERVARLRARIAELKGEKTASVERVQDEPSGKGQGIVAPPSLPTPTDAPPAHAPQR